MLVMTPEDTVSQPYVMISVYTYDMMSVRKRIGYCMKRLEDFPMYEPGNPAKPQFHPLTPMPDQADAGCASASVLVTIERSPTEDIVRHARKMVKPMMYIVRSYCFMARGIQGPP